VMNAPSSKKISIFLIAVTAKNLGAWPILFGLPDDYVEWVLLKNLFS
jgi:hypothetical protein